MAKIELTTKSMGTFIIIFMIYSVLGNSLEHFLYFVGKRKTKTLSNPVMVGFPIYGIVAYVILAIHEAIGKDLHIVLQFLLYGTVAVLIEYITGRLIGAGENGLNPDGTIRTWDYRQDPLNYQGIIKASGFIFFGLSSIVIVRIHPFLKERVGRIFDDTCTAS
jgi:uncharacterized membrane protein